MKRFLSIGLIVCFVAIMSGHSTISSQESLMSVDNDQNLPNNLSQQRCTRAVDGLIFCISSSSISVKLGQSVPLIVSVRNTTGKSISIKKDYFDSIYISTVVDSKGEKVLSLNEELQKKHQATNKITEEMIKAVPINPSFSSIKIPPGEKIETTFNLVISMTSKPKEIQSGDQKEV